jgi:hypothetical protein
MLLLNPSLLANFALITGVDSPVVGSYLVDIAEATVIGSCLFPVLTVAKASSAVAAWVGARKLNL